MYRFFLGLLLCFVLYSSTILGGGDSSLSAGAEVKPLSKMRQFQQDMLNKGLGFDSKELKGINADRVDAARLPRKKSCTTLGLLRELGLESWSPIRRLYDIASGGVASEQVRNKALKRLKSCVTNAGLVLRTIKGEQEEGVPRPAWAQELEMEASCAQCKLRCNALLLHQLSCGCFLCRNCLYVKRLHTGVCKACQWRAREDDCAWHECVYRANKEYKRMHDACCPDEMDRCECDTVKMPCGKRLRIDPAEVEPSYGAANGTKLAKEHRRRWDEWCREQALKRLQALKRQQWRSRC